MQAYHYFSVFLFCPFILVWPSISFYIIHVVSCRAYPPPSEVKSNSPWKSGSNSNRLLCCYLGVPDCRSVRAGRKCKQGSEGKTDYTEAFTVSNPWWWRARHPYKRNHSWWWCDPSHPQVANQQILQGIMLFRSFALLRIQRMDCCVIEQCIVSFVTACKLWFLGWKGRF